MSPWYLHISCKHQRLEVYHNHRCMQSMSISTGKKGTGQQKNSGKTPLGWHCIAEKFGDDAPINSVFVARKPTGEIYTSELKENNPERDWILTRILRLKGLELGVNLEGEVDTYQRYIFLHGTPVETILGVNGSKGCIRVRNRAIVKLYNQVSVGTPVYISDK